MKQEESKYKVGQEVEIVMATKFATDRLVGRKGIIVGVRQHMGEVLVDHGRKEGNYWHEFKGIKILEVKQNEKR